MDPLSPSLTHPTPNSPIQPPHPQIFEASFAANLFYFYKSLPSVMCMAVPLVIFSSVMMGFLGSKGLPYDWDFPTALLLGAILSPTDTVAPMAIMKELGAPESLQLIVEGESLLNDGSALVLFTLARGMLLSHVVPTPLEVFVSVLRLSVGGPIIGLCIGATASWVLGFILNDPLSEITITLVVGYGSFIVAESTGLHASGVLAMVVAGLYMSFYGRGRVSARVRAELNSFWALLGYISNTLIFIVAVRCGCVRKGSQPPPPTTTTQPHLTHLPAPTGPANGHARPHF